MPRGRHRHAALAGCGGGSDDVTTSTAPASTTAETSSAVEQSKSKPPPKSDIDSHAKRIDIAGDWLSGSPGSVWLSADNSVKRLDSQTGKLRTETPVIASPCLHSTVGYGALWTATCRPGGLTRIDLASAKATDHVAVEGVPTLEGANGSIAAGAGGIWIVVDGPGCEDCRLAEVDPRSLEVTSSPARLDAGSAGVAIGGGSVWVTNPVTDMLQRVDPETGGVEKIAVGDGPRYVAVGAGSVWTLDGLEGSVSRVDLASGELVTTIPAPDLAGEGGDIAFGGGSVWARGGPTLLSQIDPGTNAVVARYGPGAEGGSVTVEDGAVWLSANDHDTVWRLPLKR